VACRLEEGTDREDVSAGAGAAGDDPEAGGRRTPTRHPTIRDRVVQTAAKLVLEPIFEADLEDGAYGYRPRRSGIGAVKEVHRLLRRGYTDVVDADLSKYFDSIPHSGLLKTVARRIVDRHVLWLIIVVQRDAAADEARRSVRDLLTVFFVRVRLAFSGQPPTKKTTD
jgi:hypothetical protein